MSAVVPQAGSDLATDERAAHERASATSEAGIEKPVAPASANPRNATLPVMFATKT
jgi:hypothetical protein